MEVEVCAKVEVDVCVEVDRRQGGGRGLCSDARSSEGVGGGGFVLGWSVLRER